MNAAGEQVDLFHELAAACINAVVDEIVERLPADSGEARARAWLLVRDGASAADDFDGLSRMVAVENATTSELERAEERLPNFASARESGR